MCSKCEAVDGLNNDCEQCGKSVHVFCKVPISRFIEYLRPSRPFANRICYFVRLSWIRHAVPITKISGIEMDASIDIGWYENP
jgi:hypothetical protein